MTGCPIEVFWDDEDEVWIASVPDLPLQGTRDYLSRRCS